MTLRVENLSVRYGAVEAVRNLSFTVEPGEIVGLIGANGAGKSSTLHAIMGAAPVAGGHVAWRGRHCTAGIPKTSHGRGSRSSPRAGGSSPSSPSRRT